MSSTSSQPVGVGVQDRASGGLWRGMLIGFIPLGLLAVIVAAAIALTSGQRER